MVVKRKARTKLQEGEKAKKFKFLSFADQIAKISVDYASSSLALTHDLEQNSFFFEAVVKWIDLDYGDDFKDFLADINHEELATYSQILHFQEKIAEAIQKHLQIKESTALCAILEILIGFARDLREEFGKYFWKFFDVMIYLVECRIQNIEVVQSCFRALTVFFKLQWRDLVKNLRKSFLRLFPLFSSRQDFVRRFIAEAASFLLRKSTSIPKVLKYLVEKAYEQEDENIADGLTQLLFNCIKGTKGFFHSQTATLLNSFLDTIYSLDENVKPLGVEVMEGVMVECVHHADVKNFKVISDIILTRFANDAVKAPENVGYDLKFLRVSVIESGGYIFTEYEKALKVLTQGLNDSTILEIYFDVSADIIRTYYNKFSSKDVILRYFERAVEVIKLKEVRWLFDFYKKLVDLSIFDLWAMESVGQLGNDLLKTNPEAFSLFLNFYADVILQRFPIVFDGSYSLNKFFDSTGHQAFRKLLVKKMISSSDDDDFIYSKCLIVAPYFVKGEETNTVVTVLKKTLVDKVNKAKSDDSTALKAYLTLCCLHLMKISVDCFSLKDAIQFLKTAEHTELKLRIGDLVFTLVGSNNCNPIDFEVVMGLLKDDVGNENGNVRHLALRIMNLLAQDVLVKKVLQAMIDVEREPMTFENYRERANVLRKIKISLAEARELSDFDTFHTMAFRFTVVQFYEALTLYWPLVGDVARNLGESLSLDSLWLVFNEFIEKSSQQIRNFEESTKEDYGVLHALAQNVLKSTENRLDHWSFRLEVLKLLASFLDLAERKNRSLVPLLLDIYNNEFQSVTVTTKLHDNLTENNGVNEVPNKEDDEEEPNEGEMVLAKKLNRKLVTLTIRQILQIFAKFSNLKQVYKSAELFELINDLLRSDSSDIQKYAVECLFNYKVKELDPYKENFDNLVADKQFSDELVHFSVDEDSTVVATEHRSHVLPVLMRLLDGKMHAKSGRRGVTKRPAIFRFVAGCRAEELDLFLKTVFWTINELVDEQNLNNACTKLIQTYDPHNTIALQRISR
ncbi:unnamed protein product [Bursaphelenchus okinawaensis]|uniref:U3 small nucleolar RNA-associated protein 20 N-terminal domain-containing protein n=1 Tax=Bursaphelenchus okinawaensis TaxID=465554 RepID=A0A811K5E7_9BILA|nr:unnamed protein product [Bursaphelenchus okinawaensis]CAG9092889.1 unnamed protein product [Bursaphelenchus okinawaensis]